jgi:hypothetical protein
VFAVAAGEVLASLARVGSDDMTPRQGRTRRLLHDDSEADDDGFIGGAGLDRHGGFPATVSRDRCPTM